MLEIGVSSNNECGANYKEILTNIKKAGFENVMLSAKSGDIEEMIKCALDLGLKIPYFHLSYTFASDLWAKGKAHREYVAYLKQSIEILSKYNIPIAVVHATQGEASLLALPPSKHAVDAMNDVLKTAEKCNVKIAVENCDKPNFRSMKYLLDHIDSPWLGFCYDAGHHNLYVPRKNLLKKYGHRLLAVHLHDNLMDWKYGYDYSRDLHYLPFDGKIDYEKVCKNLAKVNYNNVVLLEIHKISNDQPYIYEDMSVEEFLGETKIRAEKIATMIENYKNRE